jgi:hypothetical protein
MVGIESANHEHECNARQRNASGPRCERNFIIDSRVDFSA